MFGNLLLSIEPAIEIVVYDVISDDYPEKMDEVQGYIITGSKMSVYEEIGWIKQLGEFVQELHKKEKTYRHLLRTSISSAFSWWKNSKIRQGMGNWNT